VTEQRHAPTRPRRKRVRKVPKMQRKKVVEMRTMSTLHHAFFFLHHDRMEKRGGLPATGATEAFSNRIPQSSSRPIQERGRPTRKPSTRGALKQPGHESPAAGCVDPAYRRELYR